MRPNFGGIFDFDKKSEKLEQVNQELEDPSIWNDQKRAQDMGKEKKALEGVVLTLEKARADLLDAADLFEMAREEGDDVVGGVARHRRDPIPWAVARAPEALGDAWS